MLRTGGEVRRAGGHNIADPGFLKDKKDSLSSSLPRPAALWTINLPWFEKTIFPRCQGRGGTGTPARPKSSGKAKLGGIQIGVRARGIPSGGVCDVATYLPLRVFLGRRF